MVTSQSTIKSPSKRSEGGSTLPAVQENPRVRLLQESMEKVMRDRDADGAGNSDLASDDECTFRPEIHEMEDK